MSCIRIIDELVSVHEFICKLKDLVVLLNMGRKDERCSGLGAAGDSFGEADMITLVHVEAKNSFQGVISLLYKSATFTFISAMSLASTT